MAARVDPLSVFLNVPFDEKHEPIFLGMVVGLVSLGLKPRSVIEIPETGWGRMARLFDLLCSCGASIHDLSRVEDKVPRFNMPFELGLAFALSRLKKAPHPFFVFEAKRFRLNKTLSDLNMLDPRIHHNKGLEAIKCVHDCIFVKGKKPPAAEAETIYRKLKRDIVRLRCGRKTLYNRVAFETLITEAFALSAAFKPSPSAKKKAPAQQKKKP